MCRAACALRRAAPFMQQRRVSGAAALQLALPRAALCAARRRRWCRKRTGSLVAPYSVHSHACWPKNWGCACSGERSERGGGAAARFAAAAAPE